MGVVGAMERPGDENLAGLENVSAAEPFREGGQVSATVGNADLEGAQLFPAVVKNFRSEILRSSFLHSTAPTDYSGVSPDVAVGATPWSKNCNADAVVQSAWKSLPDNSLHLPWENNFWEMCVSLADSSSSSHVGAQVGRRVVANFLRVARSFLHHVRDVSEVTWQEEGTATWEMAIGRRMSLLEFWDTDQVLVSRLIAQKQTFD